MSDNNAALIPLDEANEPHTVQLACYVCRVEDRYFQPGQYVRVTRIEPNGTVHFQRRDRGYTAPLDSFLDQFEYAPEGRRHSTSSARCPTRRCRACSTASP